MSDDWHKALAADRGRGERLGVIALLLSVSLGWLGADRFYLGQYGLGILKALTVGGIFVWWLFDLLLIVTDNITDVNGDHLRWR